MGRLTLPPYSKVAYLDGMGNYAVKKYYKWPFSFFYRKKLELILEMLPEKVDNILDFGCGDAKIFEPALSKRCNRLVCIDRPENIDLRWSFDRVVCASVLEFVELPKTIAQLKIVTRHTGMLVGASVMTNRFTNLYFKLIGDKHKRHHHNLIIEELSKRFKITTSTWLGIYLVFRGIPK